MYLSAWLYRHSVSLRCRWKVRLDRPLSFASRTLASPRKPPWTAPLANSSRCRIASLPEGCRQQQDPLSAGRAKIRYRQIHEGARVRVPCPVLGTNFFVPWIANAYDIIAISERRVGTGFRIAQARFDSSLLRCS